MTHYTVYDQSNPITAKTAAMRDIREHFGPELFAKMDAELSRQPDWVLFALVCQFFGIRGFPVEVWYSQIHGVRT